MGLEYNRNAVCPYCGYEDTDSWELHLRWDGDETVTACNACGEDFTVWLNLEATYSTKKTLQKESDNS